MWCVPAIDAEFITRMEDVLRLYARPLDPKAPVVCLDERPVVLRGAARDGSPMEPGQVARADYEYVRKGTANIFCIVEPKAGRRFSYATPNRKGAAFAVALARIARQYESADRIHLVMDNLSTHAKSSLVARYGEAKADALWNRFKVHYTPKHASWLNMAEMEASLISRECLGRRRLGAFDELAREVASWRKQSDKQRRVIAWRFRVNDARRVFRYDGIATSLTRH